MDGFFQDLGGKLKKASSAAAPKISEMSRSLTDGVNSLMVKETGLERLYEEDEAVGAAVNSVEDVRYLLRKLMSDVKQYRRDLLALSRSQQALGERLSPAAGSMQTLYERYLPDERVMAQLALSASEVSSSTVNGRYAADFGVALEKLGQAFEEKYQRDIVEYKRRYTSAKVEYMRQKRAAGMPGIGEGEKFDHMAKAEALAPEWQAISGPLLEMCERVAERTVKRLNDIFLNMAVAKNEAATKIGAGAEHAGQAAQAFKPTDAGEAATPGDGDGNGDSRAAAGGEPDAPTSEKDQVD